MPEKNELVSAGSEINLNLRMPQEDPDDVLSFRSVVQTIYNARLIFILCSCVGLLLGIGAAAFLLLQRPTVGSEADDAVAPEAPVDVSSVIYLNYSQPGEAIFPDGTPFEESTLFEVSLWENVLASIGLGDVSISDAISDVRIVNAKFDEAFQSMLARLPAATVQQLVSNESMEVVGLLESARGNSYTIKIPKDSTIFTTTELKEQFIIAFCEGYENYIKDRFYSDDIVSEREKRLMQAIDNLAAHAGANSYIRDAGRDIDRFVADYDAIMNSMKTELLYRQNLLESYTALLASQFDEELFVDAKSLAVSAAELARDIEQMEYYIWFSAYDAENALLYSEPIRGAAPAVAADTGMGSTMIILIAGGLVVAGVAVGFVAAYVKKYLPEKEAAGKGKK